MADCPNCGQTTGRTLDYACPHCGYPLVSGSFRSIDRTFQQTREAAAFPGPRGRLEPGEQGAAGVESEPAAGEKIPPGETAGFEIEEALAEPPPEPERPRRREMAGLTAGGEQPAEPVTTAEIEEALDEPEAVTGEPEIDPARASRLATEAAAADAAPGAEGRSAGGEPASAVAQMTVEELHAACGADRERASERFAGAAVRISGTVGKIMAGGVAGGPGFILTGPSALGKRVHCLLDEGAAGELSRIQAGHEVTVQGTIESCAETIRVAGCSLVG